VRGDSSPTADAGGDSVAKYQAEIRDCFKTTAARINRALHLLTRGDIELSRDAVQDAFEVAWRKWPEIRGYTDEQRASWLVSVAARKAIDTFRRNETERTHATAVYEHHRPAEHDVHNESLTSIAVARFSRVISEMPPARRRVAYLYWRCGWKQQEIAQELGLAPSTVCEHVRAARATLERELGPYVPFESCALERGA